MKLATSSFATYASRAELVETPSNRIVQSLAFGREMAGKVEIARCGDSAAAAAVAAAGTLVWDGIHHWCTPARSAVWLQHFDTWQVRLSVARFPF